MDDPDPRLSRPNTTVPAEGPNWRLRTIRAALGALNFNENILRHGIQREVFVSKLAANAFEVLRSGKVKPDISGLLSVAQISDLARDRWMVPRAERGEIDYRAWSRDMIPLLIRGVSKCSTSPKNKQDNSRMLASTQLLLEQHFADLAAVRKTRNNPVYALEHGLEPSKIAELCRVASTELQKVGLLNATGWCGPPSQRKRVTATKEKNTGQRLSMFRTSGATTTTARAATPFQAVQR